MSASSPSSEQLNRSTDSIEDKAARLRFRFRPFELFSFERIRGSISFMLSFILHFVLVVVLALWSTEPGTGGNANQLLVLPEVDQPLDLALEQVVTPEKIIDVQDSVREHLKNESAAFGPVSQLTDPQLDLSEAQDDSVVTANVYDMQSIFPMHQGTPAKSGGGFNGRTGDLREQLLMNRGGSRATEDAVDRALGWIAAHQLDDGSWSFDHHKKEVGKRSPNPGNPITPTGATGLALLPFLGRGYTHLNDNPYRDHIERGLYYLRTNQLVGPNGGDLQKGSMYGHGLAALALCEAYAMTKDPALKEDATQAIRFIEYAQHAEGGWRYEPKQPGDISVYGWQLMALKSGLLADIKVSSSTIGMAEIWLDRVQQADGAYYGYQYPGKMISPTSIGLLSRMYLGWKKNDPRLQKGIRFLSQEGPSKSDMYYNYYATNVLCHNDGPMWDKWNDEMKAYLVRTQSKQGYTNGSWYFEDKHAKVGGRLYVTCLATMILEVYYRHMPLYSEKSLDFTF